jgi:hypothetical protein
VSFGFAAGEVGSLEAVDPVSPEGATDWVAPVAEVAAGGSALFFDPQPASSAAQSAASAAKTIFLRLGMLIETVVFADIYGMQMQLKRPDVALFERRTRK